MENNKEEIKKFSKKSCKIFWNQIGTSLKNKKKSHLAAVDHDVATICMSFCSIEAVVEMAAIWSSNGSPIIDRLFRTECPMEDL